MLQIEKISVNFVHVVIIKLVITYMMDQVFPQGIYGEILNNQTLEVCEHVDK